MFGFDTAFLYVVTANRKLSSATIKQKFEGIDSTHVYQIEYVDYVTEEDNVSYVFIEVDKFYHVSTLEKIERKIKALYELNMITLAERIVVQERVVINNE